MEALRMELKEEAENKFDSGIQDNVRIELESKYY